MSFTFAMEVEAVLERVMTDGGLAPEKIESNRGSTRQIQRPSRWFAAWILIEARFRFPFYFRSLRLANAERLKAKISGPLVIYLNHASWWDPLPMLLLQLTLFPERVLYAPHEAVALTYGQRLPRLGFFPVERKTLKGTRQFLKDCAYVLAQPDSVLCMTPEGNFKDCRIRPVQLERGLAAVLSRAGAITVVPLAIEYTFWDGTRPELLASWGEPMCIEDGASKSIDEWHRLLTENLTRTMDELADLSQRREAWRFRALVQGRMGPANIAGLIGNLKALFRSRR